MLWQNSGVNMYIVMISYKPTDSIFDIIKCNTYEDAEELIKDSKFHKEYDNGVHKPTYEIYKIKKVKGGTKCI